jgi:hypothetical protein
MIRRMREPNRESVPCASDEHVFRPEVYDLPTDDPVLGDARCTACGWSWDEIADHDRGDCCCPGDHRTKRLKDLKDR